MSDIVVEKFYKTRAHEIVRSLFDTKILHPELTLDTIQATEDYLGYILQSTAQSASRMTELTMKIKHREKK